MFPQRHQLTQRKTCPWIIRARFNADQYVERASQGLLQTRVVRSNLTSSEMRQGPGTITELVDYIEVGVGLVARAVQFVRGRQHRRQRPSGSKVAPFWDARASSV